MGIQFTINNTTIQYVHSTNNGEWGLLNLWWSSKLQDIRCPYHVSFETSCAYETSPQSAFLPAAEYEEEKSVHVYPDVETEGRLGGLDLASKNSTTFVLSAFKTSFGVTTEELFNFVFSYFLMFFSAWIKIIIKEASCVYAGLLMRL